ncbi:Hsp20/alpha crystallin family protein [Methylorubrum extorquens]
MLRDHCRADRDGREEYRGEGGRRNADHPRRKAAQARGDERGLLYLAEWRFGAFERAFRLPQGVDAGRIEAVLRNSVLTLTLPKPSKAETAIAVQAA